VGVIGVRVRVRARVGVIGVRVRVRARVRSEELGVRS